MTFVPEDICHLRLPARPTLSADGRLVVAAVESALADGSGYASDLWIFDGVDQGARLLSDAPGPRCCVPRFGPGGAALAFLAGEKEMRELWCCSANGDGLECLASFEGEITAYEWTPAGDLVVVVDLPDRPDPEEPVLVSWLRYKSDGSDVAPYGRSEVWKILPSGDRTLLAEYQNRVTLVASNGRHSVYALEERRPDVIDEQCEIRLAGPDGADELIWQCPSKVTGLALSPTGRSVIVATNGTNTFGRDAVRLWRIDDPGHPEVALDLDIDVGYAVCGDTRPRAMPLVVQCLTDDEVLFAATARGEVGLWQGSLVTGRAERVSPGGTSLTDMSSVGANRVAVCLERCDAPSEVHLIPLAAPSDPSYAVVSGPDGDREARRLSSLNTEWLSVKQPSRPQELSIPRSDGEVIPALLYTATGASAERPSPLLVRIHGGPHLCYGSAFDLEAQIEVSAGFSVLLPNLPGSSGYGQIFREASVGQWGRGDYSDLMECVSFAAGSEVVDSQRLYLAGGSYGGYLTNWAVTRTGAFRAAISERSVSNLISKYGTADNGFSTNREEMEGVDLFDDGAVELLRRSPVHYADRVTTPLLLIHGERDQRCPMEQAEQFFVALRRLGKEVCLARFPGESHSLPYRGRPSRRISRLRLILGWLSQH